MWQPERAARGPLAATERDIPGLNRLFADAFTDRYRRDGLVGVRVPFLHAAIWRYAIADAGAGAMLWRDEQDRIVAFNIAHRSGAEGWMGPLAVRPDRQLAGVGKEIVLSAVEWLRTQGATVIGLETMPRTMDNVGFYSHLGFLPGHLTLTLTRDAQRPLGKAPYEVLGGMDAAARVARLERIRALVGSLAPGYDFTREIELTLAMSLGNVITLPREDGSGALAAFALCHSAPLAEGGTRDELRVLKVAAADAGAFAALLEAVGAWAATQGIRRVAVRCQTAYQDAYAWLVRNGFRVRWSDLRMTLADHPEVRPDQGVLWSNWEI